MVYLPFASLLGLQAALSPFASKPLPEPASAAVPFVNPTIGGGSLLNKDSGGKGEPLNVIISGLSSPWVLSDGGFVHFANAVGFGIECLGLHIGKPQKANLGDGHGWVDQRIELRNDYGNPDIGACWESLVGGNHFRMYRQNGPTANTGALFLAVSEEKVSRIPFLALDVPTPNGLNPQNLHNGHNITTNGYNLGRDSFVKGALGLKKYNRVKYQTTAQSISGMIPPGSDGINHGIPIDGIVTLLTVTIVK
ncbi:hypothetical protein BJV78DRAFT_1281183 [Lactifluus subvellereus]|nr:hypothetical protein BJV78DRAFT_1281183 [Lactifluus subvellereus]